MPNAAFYTDWSTLDWLSIVGLVLALVGIGIAIFQISQATSAAEAAKNASEATQIHLADNHLLLLIPVLSQACKDLTRAASADDRQGAAGYLDAWRETAVKVRALIQAKSTQSGDIDLIQEIGFAIALMAPAHDALNDPNQAAYDGTRHVRSRIQAATDQANQIVAEKMAFVEAA